VYVAYVDALSSLDRVYQAYIWLHLLFDIFNYFLCLFIIYCNYIIYALVNSETVFDFLWLGKQYLLCASSQCLKVRVHKVTRALRITQDCCRANEKGTLYNVDLFMSYSAAYEMYDLKCISKHPRCGDPFRLGIHTFARKAFSEWCRPIAKQ